MDHAGRDDAEVGFRGEPARDGVAGGLLRTDLRALRLSGAAAGESRLVESYAAGLRYRVGARSDAACLARTEEAGEQSGTALQPDDLPARRAKSFHVNLSLADFEPDKNTPVQGPRKLDPSRLKSIAVTDITVA